MAPTLNGGNYTKDLSVAPSLSGGASTLRLHYFLVPDDTVVYRIIEVGFRLSEFDYYAEVYRVGFHSPDFIEKYIDGLRDDGLSDEEVAEEISKLGMDDDSQNLLVARFAYDDISILDRNNVPVCAKQIRGAYVDPQMSGVGLAGQIYRQFVLMHDYLVCDNKQTEFGAALWAGTIRNVVGRVDIYDCANNKYIQELGPKGIGVGGFVPWDLNAPEPYIFQLGRWVLYPFEIKSCLHIVLVVSRY